MNNTPASGEVPATIFTDATIGAAELSTLRSGCTPALDTCAPQVPATTSVWTPWTVSGGTSLSHRRCVCLLRLSIEGAFNTHLGSHGLISNDNCPGCPGAAESVGWCSTCDLDTLALSVSRPSSATASGVHHG